MAEPDSDLLLHNGVVLTLDDRLPRARAVAVRDGRIRAVGGDELLSLRGARTTAIDLGGAVVCPGFIDAHHHLSLAVWFRLGVDLSGCRSTTDVVETLRTHRSDRAPGAWLYAHGYRPQTFQGRGLTRYDLDSVDARRPSLVLHYTVHEAVVSSAALSLAGIGPSTPDTVGGRIVRDARGEPTGLLLETAVGPVEAQARVSLAPDQYHDWLAVLQSYSTELFAAGITHVCDPGVDGLFQDFFHRAHADAALPLPVTMGFVSQRGLFLAPGDRLAGPRTGAGPSDLQVGPLKIFADGGNRCAVCARPWEALTGVAGLVGRAARTGRLRELMSGSGGAPDRPRLGRDCRLHLGFLHYEKDALARLCRDAAAAGFQIATHAACNEGIDHTISAYAAMEAGAAPHRIEHLVSLDRRQAMQIAALGVVGVVQPIYVEAMGDEWALLATPPRLRSVPLRMLLDAGVVLAGSSDVPVAPFAPLRGMQVARTRRTAAGLAFDPEQAISGIEALRMWTTGSAAALGRVGEIGVLRRGARADLVVLDRDPVETHPDELTRIRVLRTIIGGRTVHQT